MSVIDTNTEIETIELSETEGTWIVRGTTDIDTASAHVVRLIVDKAGSDAEVVGAEVIALVEASKTAQTSDLWYFLDDGGHDPVLRLMGPRGAQAAGCSHEFFVGVLFGAHVQASQ